MSAISYASYAQMEYSANKNTIIIGNNLRIADPNSPRYGSEQSRAASLMHHITTSLQYGSNAERLPVWMELRNLAQKAIVDQQELREKNKLDTYRISSILQASTTEVSESQLKASVNAVQYMKRISRFIPASISAKEKDVILGIISKSAIFAAQGKTENAHNNELSSSAGNIIAQILKEDNFKKFSECVALIYNETKNANLQNIDMDGRTNATYDESKLGLIHVHLHEQLINSVQDDQLDAAEATGIQTVLEDAKTHKTMDDTTRLALSKALIHVPITNLFNPYDRNILPAIESLVENQKEISLLIPETTTAQSRKSILDAVENSIIIENEEIRLDSDRSNLTPNESNALNNILKSEEFANFASSLKNVFDKTADLDLKDLTTTPTIEHTDKSNVEEITPEQRADLTLKIIRQSFQVVDGNQPADLENEKPFSENERALFNIAVRAQTIIQSKLNTDYNEEFGDEKEKVQFLIWMTNKAITQDSELPAWLQTQNKAEIAHLLTTSDLFNSYRKAVQELKDNGRDPRFIAKAIIMEPMKNAIIVMDSRPQAMIAEAWINWASTAGPNLPEPGTIQIIANAIKSRFSRAITEIEKSTIKVPISEDKVSVEIYKKAALKQEQLKIATTINAAFASLSHVKPEEMNSSEFESLAVNLIQEKVKQSGYLERLILSHPATMIAKKAMPYLIDNISKANPAQNNDVSTDQVIKTLAATKSIIPVAIPVLNEPLQLSDEHNHHRNNAIIARQALRAQILKSESKEFNELDATGKSKILAALDSHIFYNKPSLNEMDSLTLQCTNEKAFNIYNANIQKLLSDGLSQERIKEAIGATSYKTVLEESNKQFLKSVRAQMTPLNINGEYLHTTSKSRTKTIQNPILGPNSTGLRFPVVAVEAARYIKKPESLIQNIENLALEAKDKGLSIAVSYDSGSKGFAIISDKTNEFGLEALEVIASHTETSIKHETSAGQKNLRQRNNKLTIIIPKTENSEIKKIDLYSSEGQRLARGKLLVIHSDDIMIKWQAVASISTRLEAYGLTSADFPTSQQVRRFIEAGKQISATDGKDSPLKTSEAYKIALIGAPTTKEQANRIDTNFLDAPVNGPLSKLVLNKVIGYSPEKIKSITESFNTLGELIEFANTPITEVKELEKNDKKFIKLIANNLGEGLTTLRNPVKINNIIENSYNELKTARESDASIATDGKHAKAFRAPVIQYGPDSPDKLIAVIGQNETIDTNNDKNIKELLSGIKKSGSGIIISDEAGVAKQVLDEAMRLKIPVTVYSNLAGNKKRTHDLLRLAEKGELTLISPNTLFTSDSSHHRNRSALLTAICERSSGIILAGAHKSDISTLVTAEAGTKFKIPVAVTPQPEIFTQIEKEKIENAYKQEKIARANYERASARLDMLLTQDNPKAQRQKEDPGIISQLMEQVKISEKNLETATRFRETSYSSITKDWEKNGTTPQERYSGNKLLTIPNSQVSAVTIKTGLVTDALGVGYVGPDGRFEKQASDPSAGIAYGSTRSVRTASLPRPAITLSSEEKVLAFVENAVNYKQKKETNIHKQISSQSYIEM